MKALSRSFFVMLTLLATVGFASAQDDADVVLRILWFDDGSESTVLDQQLQAFEAEYPNINVELDLLPYSSNEQVLRDQIANGNMPDLARHTLLGGFSDYYLDLRPYMTDPDAWAARFPEPMLAAMRDADDGGLHGYGLELTVSAPFINRTLWEEAGVAVPSDTDPDVTWDEWEAAAAEVQAALSGDGREVYALAMDRSGHRFWGPSLSMCATYLNPDNTVTVDTPGFRAAAQMLLDWHNEGLTPLNIWGALGDEYRDADALFLEGDIAFYFSGSWQVANITENADFAWDVVPNPVGECGRTGMIGGSVLTAMSETENPEAVALLVEFLTREDNLAEFYAANLMLPSDVNMAETGLDYPVSADVLNKFTAQLNDVLPEAYRLQYHPDSGAIGNVLRIRLIDMIIQDIPPAETAALIQSDLEELGLAP